MPAGYTPNPTELALLCKVIREVASRGGLRAEDAEDFSQAVHLKMLERSYAPLQHFSGRSSLRTYLTVVVRRLLIDWRNERLGKWRPCAAARRLGPVAMELDRLISREGHPVEEAIGIVSGRPDAPPPDVLRRVAAQLPRHAPVRLVCCEPAETLSVQGFEDPIAAREAALARERDLRRLRRACRELSPDDQRLLSLHFQHRLPMAAIASILGCDAKPLYRRLYRVFRTLRSRVAPVRQRAARQAAR